MPPDWNAVVAGGGPAGFLAAITAAEAGLERVLILEAGREPLGKVRISGGGRCNVTHACWDPADLVGHYPRGSRPLRGPFSRFAAGDAVAWFEARGLRLKQEADGRLFPVSDRSEDVIACLQRAAHRAGVVLRTGVALKGIEPLPGGGFRLTAAAPAGAAAAGSGALRSRSLLLATGSHPSGRRLLAPLGLKLVPPVPSLFSLTLPESGLAGLAGVVADPVRLELRVGRRRFRQRGALLITHRGVSGPAVLRLSAFAARDLHDAGVRGELLVDWTDGLSSEAVATLLADGRGRHGGALLVNRKPWPGLGRRLWQQLLQGAGLDPRSPWATLSRAGAARLGTLLRASRYEVRGRGPFGEEFVTAGGVSLSEVDLARMESRRWPGLFLAGELLDVDGVTGGFNFQHCWTSGWIAGRAMAAAAAPSTDLIEDREHGQIHRNQDHADDPANKHNHQRLKQSRE